MLGFIRKNTVSGSIGRLLNYAVGSTTLGVAVWIFKFPPTNDPHALAMVSGIILLTVEFIFFVSCENIAKDYESEIKNQKKFLETDRNDYQKILSILELSDNGLAKLVTEKAYSDLENTLSNEEICLQDVVCVDVSFERPKISFEIALIRKTIEGERDDLKSRIEALKKEEIKKPKSYVFFEKLFSPKKEVAVC